MIELANPWMLALLPLPLLAFAVLPPWPARSWLQISDWSARSLGSLSSRQHLLPSNRPRELTAAIVGWVALVVALAGPRTDIGEILIPSGRDLILAIDLSASMGQKDIAAEKDELRRIDVVGELAANFVAERRGDRLGLIGFAQSAYLIAPLTFDHQAIAGYLKERAIGLPGRRTDLATSIGLIVKVLSEQPENARVAVLLTDGESNSGDLTPHDAAKLAASHGIKLHTIGFSPGDTGDILPAIAKISGGRHFDAHSPTALAEVYRELNSIEPVPSISEPRILHRDWSDWALLVVLAAWGWRALGYWRRW